MVTQTKNRMEDFKYVYPPACSGGTYAYFGTFPAAFEYVESYRGPHQFVDVGPKRRRKFNPFVRFRYSFNEPSEFRWCPAGGRITLKGYNIPQVNIQWCMDLPLSSSNPFTGDWPLIGRLRMDQFVLSQNEKTASDLFVKMHEPRFDGLVFAAELDETLVGIKKLLLGAAEPFYKPDNLRKLTDTLSVARKSGGAQKAIEIEQRLILNPQELWLWYRYALMPAILSVKDLLDALSTKVKIDRIQAGSRSKTTVLSGTLLHPGWDMGVGSYSTLEMPWTTELTTGRGGALDFQFLHDPNEWGFGGVDVFRAVYERIPFSFVLDWIVKLGDWLTTLREIEFEMVQSYSTVAVQTVTNFMPGEDCFYAGQNPVLTCFLQKRITELKPPTTPLIDRDWRNLRRTIDTISLTIGFLKGILQTMRPVKARKR